MKSTMIRSRSKTAGRFSGGVGRWLLAALGLVAALAASRATLAAETEGSKPVCGPYGDLPQEYSPMASRDGSTLVWLRHSWRNRLDRLFVAARDGSRAVPGPFGTYVGAIAPDGSEVLIGSGILASTRRAESRIVSESEVAEIRRAWRTPEWSPDGRFRVLADQDGLLIVPADGGPSRRIATPEVQTDAPAWSPDGEWIAFEGHGAGSGSDLHVVRSDGSGHRRLARVAYPGGATWSPDGSLIAFMIDDTDVHGGTSIAVVRPNGSGMKVLAGGHQGPDRRSAATVSWIDSRTLVFSSHGLRGGPNKVADIHTIRSDGRGERRITYQCHIGTHGDDTLSGSILGDTIRTLGGDDVVAPGPGMDDVDTATGNDIVQAARDRTRDHIRCGPGKDTVFADRRDVVHGCERVLRR